MKRKWKEKFQRKYSNSFMNLNVWEAVSEINPKINVKHRIAWTAATLAKLELCLENFSNEK